MAYTYANLETQVRLKVNDTTADVEEAIDEAINYISSFFQLEKISTSVVTVANQSYIDKPTRCLEIMRVIVDTVEYDKAGVKQLKDADEYDTKTWIDWNDKIQLTPIPDGAKATIIWYRAAFTPLAGTGTTDVPDRLVPLIIILAAWFYFLEIMMKVNTQRENFPDMTPDEAKDIAKQMKDQFDTLMDSVRPQN